MRSRMSWSFGDDSVSPVALSLSPIAATMMPAPTRSTRSRLSACTWNRRATFSFFLRRALYTSSPTESVPE